MNLFYSQNQHQDLNQIKKIELSQIGLYQNFSDEAVLIPCH